MIKNYFFLILKVHVFILHKILSINFHANPKTRQNTTTLKHVNNVLSGYECSQMLVKLTMVLEIPHYYQL